MAGSLALRALFGTTLGLGALDVAWLDLAIAPQLFGGEPADRGAPVPVVATSTASLLGPSATEPVAPPVTTATAPDPVATIERVYFASLSTDIEAEARDALAAIAKRAVDDLVVIGHSDHRGDPELNRDLRLRRAIAVRDHLALLGISSDRVTVRAAEPAEATTEEADLWRDRRVEIHFTTRGGSR